MADRHRVGYFPGGGMRFVPLLDLNDDINIVPVRDTFSVVSHQENSIPARSSRRYGGSWTAAESHENGSITCEWYVGNGQSADQALQTFDSLVALFETDRSDLFYEWRPDGTTRSTYYQIRGDQQWESMYSWVEFQGTKRLHIRGGWEIAPLAYGDPMDVYDNFSVDSTADYTFDTGTGTLIVPDTYAETILASGPVMYWRMGTNGLTDASGNGRNGVMTGAGAALGGVAGALTGDSDLATDFDGVNDGARTTAFQPFTGSPRTIEMWGWSDAGGNLWGSDSATGPMFNVDGSNNVTFRPDASSGLNNSVWSAAWPGTGQWVHCVFVFDDGSNFVRLYINGRLISQLSQTATYTTATGLFRVSGYGLDATPVAPWDGRVDEVAIYGRVLSDAEVLEHYNAGLAKFPSKMVPTTTADKRVVHTGRGYTHTDVQTTLKVTTGSTISGAFNMIVKRLDANNYIRAEYVSNALNLYRVDNGVSTTLNGAGAVISLAANTDYWLRMRTERNLVTAEFWTSEPTPLGTPTASLSVASPGYLTGAQATKFGEGVAGAVGFGHGTPAPIDVRYDEFRVEPYTYQRTGSQTVAAHEFTLSVPGTAPAEVDILTTVPAFQQAHFALMGWTQKLGVENWVWNGDFENPSGAVLGWLTSGGTFNQAASSFTRVTTQAKYGTASGEVVSTTTNLSGVRAPIYRRFKKGTTYTAQGWVRGTTTGEGVQLLFGAQGAGSDVAASQLTLTNSWQFVSAAWTPTADRDAAELAIRINDATPIATTFQIDGVCVFEGTTAPTGRQLEGAGALAPFGLIEAELLTPAPAADGNSSGGYQLTSAGGAVQATFYVDPALASRDLFSNSITVEIWAIVNAASDVTLSVYAQAAGGSDATIYSELGSAGRISKYNGTNSRRLSRVGALTLPVDNISTARAQIGVTATRTSGTGVSIDSLILVPAQSRASSVTGKATADTAKFLDTNTGVQVETSKLLRSDLSALLDIGARRSFGSSIGLAGQRLEFPPGTVRTVHKLGISTVDDPVGAASANQDALATSTMAVHYSIWPRYHLTRSV